MKASASMGCCNATISSPPFLYPVRIWGLHVCIPGVFQAAMAGILTVVGQVVLASMHGLMHHTVGPALSTIFLPTFSCHFNYVYIIRAKLSCRISRASY